MLWQGPGWCQRCPHTPLPLPTCSSIGGRILCETPDPEGTRDPLHPWQQI